VHKRSEPSAFGTKTIGDAHGLSERLMIPKFNNSEISFSTKTAFLGVTNKDVMRLVLTQESSQYGECAT